MIKVVIKPKQIEISGHAMFADYGNDIVCAAASSIVITTVNGILSLDKNSLKYTLNDDGLKVDILKDDEIYNKLILNMINLLKELSNQYKKNIQIYEEV